MTPTQPPQTPEEKAEAYSSGKTNRHIVQADYLAGYSEGLKDALSSPEVMGLIEALKDAAASERRCSEGCHSVYEKPGKNRFELVIQRFQSLSGREYSNVGEE